MPTKRLTLWLDTTTISILKGLADQRKTKVSYLAEEFIRDGLSLLAEDRLDGPALPALRQLIEEITGRQTERLAGLLVKTHLEAGIAERLTFVLLAQASGPDKARQFLDTARTKSIEALKKPIGAQKSAE